MNRICVALFLGAIILLPVKGFSNDVVLVDAQLQYQLARTLFEEKDFSAAAHEYIRFFHLFPTHERAAEARYNTGVCFFLAGRLDDAERHLKKISARFSDSGFAGPAMFKLGEVYTAMDKPGMAVAVLKNLITLTRDAQVRDRACFVIGWLLLDKAEQLKQRSDFDLHPVREAERYFSMISPQGRKRYWMDKSMASLETISQIKKKKPAVAGALAVVPGAGFLYCERYRDALVSFLLNSSLMMAAWQSFENDNAFLGGAISFVEAGFYAGNIYGSVSSAHKYNRQKQKEFIFKLKQDYKVQDKVSVQTGFINNGMAVMVNYKF